MTSNSRTDSRTTRDIDTPRTRFAGGRPWQIAIALAVTFAAGFLFATWLVFPATSSAQGELPFEGLEMEFGRKGIHLESRSKEMLFVAVTWHEGEPAFYPIQPDGEGLLLPPDDAGEDWGIYGMRFLPCRFGECTDPVPPPDLFIQGGLVFWDGNEVKRALCRTCDRQDCCPEP